MNRFVRRLEEFLGLVRQQPLDPLAAAGRSTMRAAGFSLLELERAGLTEQRALELGLVIDRKRPSALGSNVLQLKEFLKRR